jgi:hypothetical protein
MSINPFGCLECTHLGSFTDARYGVLALSPNRTNS